MSRQETLHFINAAHFFDHFFLLIFPTAALGIAPLWQMTYAQTLAMGTPLYVMFAIGTLPAGWLGDHFDRVKLIALFFSGCGTSSLFIAASSTPITFMFGLGSLGLFAAIYHPVGLAHVTQIGLRTGRALAINGVFGNMGLAGAALVTGVLTQTYGWQMAFAVPGTVSLGIGVILFLRCRKAPSLNTHSCPIEQRDDVPAKNKRIQILVFTIICIAALFGGLIFNTITLSLPKFFDERLTDVAGNLSWIGASAGLVFAIAAFAQLPVGELLDKYGARPILITLLCAQVVLLVCLTQVSGWIALVLALLLVTMIFAEIPITSWLLGRYIRTNLRSRAISAEYILSLGMSAAALPMIAKLHGLGFGFSYQFVGLALSACIVLGAALMLPRKT